MFDPADYYYHSHTSVNDGSPAMVRAHTATTIWLQNEDGHVWSDPIDQWEAIENPVYPPEWEDDEDEYPYAHQSQSGAEFMAAYYNSDSYINYLNGN